MQRSSRAISPNDSARSTFRSPTSRLRSSTRSTTQCRRRARRRRSFRKIARTDFRRTPRPDARSRAGHLTREFTAFQQLLVDHDVAFALLSKRSVLRLRSIDMATRRGMIASAIVHGGIALLVLHVHTTTDPAPDPIEIDLVDA